MGDYTDTQKFYLINPTEFVNVEQDLNYNLRLADLRVRALVNYTKTDVQSISASDIVKDVGFKWWKRYSNSLWVYSSGNIRQDVNSVVPTWNTTGFSFEAGYGSINLEKDRTGWVKDSMGFVRWRGKIGLSNGNALPANTTVRLMTVTDLTMLPSRGKYFFVGGGDDTASQTARIFITANNSGDPRIEYFKMGGNGSSAGERYLSLNEIWYPTDDV